MKNIAILGSTGSIGQNALRVIDALGEDYRVVALTAHNNIELLAEQVSKYSPEMVGLTNADKLADFKALLADFDGEILAGTDCLAEIVKTVSADIVLSAIISAQTKSCVTTIDVIFNSFCKFRISSLISFVVIGSRPVVGSS